MDEIQKVLIKAGRKDLAQKYYEKVSSETGSYMLNDDSGGYIQHKYDIPLGEPKHRGNATVNDYPDNPSFIDHVRTKHEMWPLFDMKYNGLKIRIYRNFNDQYNTADSSGKPPTAEMQKYQKKMDKAISIAKQVIDGRK